MEVGVLMKPLLYKTKQIKCDNQNIYVLIYSGSVQMLS